ncbi:hypothetical protein H5410_021041 [Solanum commersonii]|uniref:Uncharacterized protein n=1 Tax=Solanum commersonii TaxID=4109 RepID=A0A9J5ZD39_SOLCO|nr:hypothetical protein H5410_021041 [Solanum commersonii]
MAQNSSCRKRPNIIITGTPCTWKMTTTASLAMVTDLGHINIGNFANEENLTNDWDDTFDCYYINEDLACVCGRRLLKVGFGNHVTMTITFHRNGSYMTWFKS